MATWGATQGERVFFSSDARLPKDTPEGIRALRKQELLGLQVSIMPAYILLLHTPSCCTKPRDTCMCLVPFVRGTEVRAHICKRAPKAVLQSSGVRSWLHIVLAEGEQGVGLWDERSCSTCQLVHDDTTLALACAQGLQPDGSPVGNLNQARVRTDRIYQYDVYNDLSNPDVLDLCRPALGGAGMPFPRRLRSNRKIARDSVDQREPGIESRVPGSYSALLPCGLLCSTAVCTRKLACQ